MYCGSLLTTNHTETESNKTNFIHNFKMFAKLQNDIQALSIKQLKRFNFMQYTMDSVK